MSDKQWSSKSNNDNHPCFCIGPQDGGTLCPCQLKGKKQIKPPVNVDTIGHCDHEKRSAAVKALLLPASRQYRHNDGSELIFGYEEEGAEYAVDKLLSDIHELRDGKDQLKQQLSEVSGERDCLKAEHDQVLAYLSKVLDVAFMEGAGPLFRSAAKENPAQSLLAIQQKVERETIERCVEVLSDKNLYSAINSLNSAPITCIARDAVRDIESAYKD